MRSFRMLRVWDRVKAQFVDVPVEDPVDVQLSCEFCRYFEQKGCICNGVGSEFYNKQLPFPQYVPKKNECIVRLPPDLMTFT
jgi:hypothetical protein